jgi:hypothetical protein
MPNHPSHPSSWHVLFCDVLLLSRLMFPYQAVAYPRHAQPMEMERLQARRSGLWSILLGSAGGSRIGFVCGGTRWRLIFLEPLNSLPV